MRAARVTRTVLVTGGRGLKNRYENKAGHTRMKMLKEYYGANVPAVEERQFDRKLTFFAAQSDAIHGSGLRLRRR